ncbi:MAG TPA: GAF domain-containing protein [Trueperaceae bacterium]
MNEAEFALLAERSAPPGYDELLRMSRSLFVGERDFIANSANLSALLYQFLPDINWCGFYLLRGRELVLGPFQGKVACVRIAVGKGVCGTSAAQRRTLIVPDVEAFPGHIACDAVSRSEIVVPMLAGDRLLGVLDIDSPNRSRFGVEDGEGLERIVEALLVASDPPHLG